MSNSQQVRAYQEIIKKNKKELLDIPLVHGISIGYKEVGGVKTDQIALVAFVFEKLDSNQLKEREIFSNVVSGIEAGIVTDVVTKARPRELFLKVSKQALDVTEDTSKYRPLIGGCRIATESATHYHFGTGGFMADSTSSSSQKNIVTNYHVVNESEDNKVYQPSVSNSNFIGDVGNTAYSTKVDGAQVKLNSSLESENKIIEIGAVAGTKAPELNDLVQKYGFKTQLTEGKITNLSYSGTSSGGRVFDDQVVISKRTSSDPAIADNGDSGSAIVLEENNKIVALLWGGSNSGDEAYASPIGDVERELNVTVATD